MKKEKTEKTEHERFSKHITHHVIRRCHYLTGNELRVLLVLISYSNNNTHECAISNELVAEEAYVSKENLYKIYQKLTKYGHHKVIGQNKYHNAIRRVTPYQDFS